MATDIEYALMAGASYISTRADVNQFPVPLDWLENVGKREKDSATGFEATYFINGTTLANSTEIVISYAGTDPKSPADLVADAWLASGSIHDQLRQAADYYLAVKASAPTGTRITLTGHSLGGGLASLIAVMFGETAVTFDQAPFLNSAKIVLRTDPLTGISDDHSVAQDLSTYLGARSPAVLEAYIRANELFNPARIAADTLVERSKRVRNINVQGEFLSDWFGSLPTGWIGSPTEIKNSNAGVFAINLHSQALLTAFLQSDATATTVVGIKQTLSDVTFKLTNLLPMMFDPKLYSFDTDTTNTTERNFLENLVRHQTGLRDPATGVTTLAADAMVTRFTTDLWRIAQSGGLTMSNNDLTNALTAFVMQMYYENATAAADKNKTLFTATGVAGGLRFDRADVAATLDAMKGYNLYLKTFLATLPAAEQQAIAENLPRLTDWFIQAGTSPMTATATDKAAFLLGGNGADNLTGGSQDDLLIGQGGNDILTGRVGNDIVLGGQGLDSYLWRTGDGADTLIDTDKRGRLLINGQGIKALLKQPDGTWTTPDGKVTLSQTDGRWKLSMDGGSLDLGTSFTDGDYGIRRLETPALIPRTKGGDLEPILNGGQLQYDALDNVIVDPTTVHNGRADTLYGSTGNDRIQGLGGDDVLIGQAGHDILEGGIGSDVVKGETGNDLVLGDGYTTVDAAFVAGNTQNALGAQGNWLDGGSGDDTGADNLTGGSGADLLIGQGGMDTLRGGGGQDTLVGSTGGDTLEGGAEDDLYIINTGDGVIHVKDSGRNRIRYNGELLTGAFVQDVVGGVYRFVAGKSRRWRHGEQESRAANDVQWRRQA